MSQSDQRQEHGSPATPARLLDRPIHAGGALHHGTFVSHAHSVTQGPCQPTMSAQAPSGSGLRRPTGLCGEAEVDRCPPLTGHVSGQSAGTLAAMEAGTISDLVHLPAQRAVARHFDAANYRAVRWMILVTTVTGLAVTPILIQQGALWRGLAWLPVVVAGGAIFWSRSSAFFERHGRRLTMLYLVLLLAASVFSLPEPEPSYAFAAYVLPSLLLFLRLDRLEHLALAAIDLTVMALCLLQDGMPQDAGSKIGMAFGGVFFVGIVLWVTMSTTRRGRDAFLEVWRREVSRDRESSRMRSELEDARDVQLSMLPVGAPTLDWVDFSSVSLPASEVGGDYFDYFELPGSRLAIVIGDVAGHGMASGLVLSGVRSSLHLLRHELSRPVEVLRRIDQMLRETVGGRIFVTFQIAVLDPARGRLTVANAGHPPLFLAGADGRVRRLGASGLPLGTRLPADFSEESAPLAEGDALLLVSDGVAELRDLKDDDFGEQRLLEALQRSRSPAGARQIRDGVLGALSRFKGDAPQDDDITLVVARVGALRSRR